MSNKLNATPKWKEIIHLLIFYIESGGVARRLAVKELERMAKLADERNDLVKKRTISKKN
jgi:hypothetical protein